MRRPLWVGLILTICTQSNVSNVPSRMSVGLPGDSNASLQVDSGLPCGCDSSPELAELEGGGRGRQN